MRARGEAVGKPGVARVYTNQRLNLSKPWEDLRMTSQGFKPGSGNPTVRHYRGHWETYAMVRLRPHPAIERAGTETPHLQRGAPNFYPNRRHHSKPDPRLDPTRLPLAEVAPFDERSVVSQKYCGRETAVVRQLRVALLSHIPSCV